MIDACDGLRDTILGRRRACSTQYWQDFGEELQWKRHYMERFLIAILCDIKP
jgi:hypothetical protein